MGTYWTATIILGGDAGPELEPTSIPWWSVNSGEFSDIFNINQSGGLIPNNPNGVSIVSMPSSVTVDLDGGVTPSPITVIIYDGDDVLQAGDALYVSYSPGYMIHPAAYGSGGLSRTVYSSSSTTSTTTAAPTTTTTTAAPTTTTPLPGSPYYTGGIDIGKYVILVVGPDLVFKHPDLQEYTENGAAAFAGMISQLDSTQSTTNVNLPDEITPAFQFTQSQLNKLNSGIGFVNENLLRI